MDSIEYRDSKNHILTPKPDQMEKLENFLTEDDSYGNDETAAMLVYLSKSCAIRVMLPSEHYEGYTFSQCQEECCANIADYLEDKFDGDVFTEEEICQILNSNLNLLAKLNKI
jgi:hypothetical protein